MDSGIYVIFNQLKWRIYVGSSMSISARWRKHLNALRAGKHVNAFLQADFNICGEAAFTVHVLESLPTATMVERLTREEYWISLHFDGGRNCYNLTSKAISREGKLARDPQQTKLRLQKAQLGKKHSEVTKQKIRDKALGRVTSASTKEKLSKAMQGRGHAVSAETRRKISEGNQKAWTRRKELLCQR